MTIVIQATTTRWLARRLGLLEKGGVGLSVEINKGFIPSVRK